MTTTQERLVQSNNKKTMKPLDQEIATHEACVAIRIEIGAALVLVALGGRTHATDGVKNKTVCRCQAWIMGSSLAETTVTTQGGQFFWWGESQAEHDDLVACLSSAKVWREKFESLDRFGSPELTASSDNTPAVLAGRDLLIRELKERLCVRAIAQAPPKYDSASGGMVENALTLREEMLRTLVTQWVILGCENEKEDACRRC